ncbi:Transposon Tf2-6 polyprotein [Anthophora plagiata]
MGRQSGQTSLELRELIINHFKGGLSVRNIAKIVKRSHSTVHDVIRRFRTRNSVENQSKPSKRKIFTESEERWIVRQVKNNPKLAIEAKRYLGKEANVSAIADLLSCFDGSSNTFIMWERQVQTLKATYQLTDDTTKLLMGSRLKGNALEWLHSKPEHITMSVEKLLDNLREMFYHPENVLETRRRFEARVWKKEEAFSEYVHQKVILRNRVPVSDTEIIEYIIEGIPDRGLRDLTRVQKIATKGELLAAFDRITLRRRSLPFSPATKPRESKWAPAKIEKQDKKEVPNNELRCFNCGDKNHLSVNCPAKSKGPRYFACRDFGHRAIDCKKGQDKQVNEYTAVAIRDNKVYKPVTLLDKQVVAFLDMGSDLHLMRAEQYSRPLGCPSLCGTEISCKGFGLSRVTTLGSFYADVQIDNNVFRLLIHVVPDEYLRHNLLIGSELLEEAKLVLDGKNVEVSKCVNRVTNSYDVPEIFYIDTFDESENNITDALVDLQHVKNNTVKQEIEDIVNNYVPKATKESNIKMQIVLSRRLAPVQREIVNKQIDEWLREGIVRESTSQYASPIVLVKKKDGETRLCIDYRLFNKKISKDRYPLPLIEDQLDSLQGATIFSTLDLKDSFFHIVPDGHFEFLRPPFGLCNSPAIFQKCINAIFRSLIKASIMLTFIDDLIIPANDESEAVSRLREILCIASDYGLRINWKKCRFLQRNVEYLDHIIEDGRVRPSKHKALAVTNFPPIKNIKDVQSFLGLTGYFRKFIPQYSTIAQPLSNLLRKDVKFELNEKQMFALQQLKVALVNEPVLKLYRVGAPIELHTDASSVGLGAILLQKDDVDQRLENRRSFNRNRREARRYQEGNLVAIKRTQSGPGLKFAHKYLGPHQITRVLRNDRYLVEKVGGHEGPRQTSTAAKNMKSWIEDSEDSLTDNENTFDI